MSMMKTTESGKRWRPRSVIGRLASLNQSTSSSTVAHHLSFLPSCSLQHTRHLHIFPLIPTLACPRFPHGFSYSDPLHLTKNIHKVHQTRTPEAIPTVRSESYVLVLRSNAANRQDTITTVPHVNYSFKSLPRSYGKRRSGPEIVLNTFFLD